MKKYLLLALLGLGTILSTSEAKSSMVVQSRVIAIGIDGNAFIANSDAASGTILQIQIYAVPSGELVRTQGCEGYSCSCSLQGLAPGYYIGYAIAQNGSASKKFKL